MTLNNIRKKLIAIKAMGYVKSHRKGATGIGKTLEDLLGIKENNIAFPDFGSIELKASRKSHSGLITLFTFNRKAWIMNPLDAIKKYGSFDKKGRLGMYYTMKNTPNNAGLFLYVDDRYLMVKHLDGTKVVKWRLEDLKRRFDDKTKNILFVQAQVEVRAGVEYFLFDEAHLFSGGTTIEKLKSELQQERLLVDLRLHDKKTSARNHGTGFRTYEKYLRYLYSTIEEIPLSQK